MSFLENSEEFLFFTVDYFFWKFFFKWIHPSYKIIWCNIAFHNKLTSLPWSSTTSTDKYNLFSGIEFIHPYRENMERNITSLRNMYFIIFSSSSYIDEFDFLRSFFEKRIELFWSDSEHRFYFLQNIDWIWFMSSRTRGSAIIYETYWPFFSESRIHSSLILPRNWESWDCPIAQYFSRSPTVFGHSRSLQRIMNLFGWARSLRSPATSSVFFSRSCSFSISVIYLKTSIIL